MHTLGVCLLLLEYVRRLDGVTVCECQVLRNVGECTVSNAIDAVISLPNPIGRITRKSEMPSGLLWIGGSWRAPLASCVRSRSGPEAGVQIASLTLKSGNALILKGGKEASRSNQAIYTTIRDGLQEGQLREPERTTMRIHNPGHADTADTSNTHIYMHTLRK